MKQMIPKPKDHAEEVALFRHGIIGALLGQIFSHGQLRNSLKELARKVWRPPGSDISKKYGISTIERWYYAYKSDGLKGLLPRKRSDVGRAKYLSKKKRKMLYDIRDEFPWYSSRMIIKTLVRHGVLEQKEISVATLNRFYKQHRLERQTRKKQGNDPKHRLRWQVETPGILYHTDVCHGPNLKHDGIIIPVRIHAILDDASRYIVALEVHTREREVEMLGMFVKALVRTGKPKGLYMDNGATYRGDALKLICARLGVGFTHATPYNPKARGKMERFWRTMREQCLNFITEEASLHDIQVRLNAWLDHDYHKDPHAGLLGDNPTRAWGRQERETTPVTHEEIKEASLVTENRRVRGDNTLQIDGITYEVDASFLSRKTVTLGKYTYPISEDYPPFITHEGRVWPLYPVDPVKNSQRKRDKRSPAKTPSQSGINPADTVLEVAKGTIKETP